MPDWRTRLAVTYFDPDTQAPVDITPIDSFAPSFGLAAEPLHSIEQTHIGAVYSPESMTFTMTVKTIGPVAAQLTKLAMNGARFNIALHVNTGTDWAFDSILLSDCIITSATPTSAGVSGAPTATFSGFSLAAEAKASPSGASLATLP